MENTKVLDAAKNAASKASQSPDKRRTLIQEALMKNQQSFGRVQYEKMAYSRSLAKYVLFLRAQSSLSMVKLLHLQQYVIKSCPQLPPNLKIVVRQPRSAVEEDAQLLEKTLQEFVTVKEPALIPFINQCRIVRDGSFIDITFARELGPDLMRRLGVDVKMEAFLRETYEADWRIRELSCGNVEEKEHKHTSELFAQQLKKQMENRPAEPVFAPAPQKAAAPSRPAEKRTENTAAGDTPPWQNRRQQAALVVQSIAERPMDMSRLQEGSEVVIEGELLPVECFLTRSGKATIINFALTDYTTSIPCKVFRRGDKRDIVGDLKAGKWFRAKGKYAFDDYAGENVLEVSVMAPAEAPPKPKDTAEHKRVELHLHTNMSAQDGISSAASYIKRAAEWGHKAIAITDHGVVQS
ncbi:MAG: PHP domain-containing protein, partial [Christensenellaceae bacterium]|nr:PHP domain-containing protein [Christensenellaceae bacterium]